MVPFSIGAPHLGQFMWMGSLLVKTKTPLSHQRDKGVNLCGTTLLAGKDSDPATQVCPVTGAGRRGLLLVQPSAPRGSSPRPPVRLAPNGGSLCVLEAGTWPFLRILAIYSPILSASLRLVKNFYCQFCAPGAYWPLAEGRAGQCAAPAVLGCALGSGIPPPLRGTPLCQGGRFRAGG